jgi:hypothetical protein
LSWQSYDQYPHISSNCDVIITFPWLRRGHFHVWRGEIMSTTCFSWLEALTVEEHHLYHWFNLVYQYHIWLNADSFIKSMAHERFKDPICWLPLRKLSIASKTNNHSNYSTWKMWEELARTL